MDLQIHVSFSSNSFDLLIIWLKGFFFFFWMRIEGMGKLFQLLISSVFEVWILTFVCMEV